ncbi:MAG TPA: YaiO family outer membrane beta-barrel protein [Flavobacterium sp.]
MKKKFTIILLLFTVFSVTAQKNIAFLLNEAKGYAAQENYKKALEILKEAEAEFPSNEELTIYKGRVYSWKKDYATAATILQPLADKEQPNAEALIAIINTFYWWNKYDKCLKYCNKYLIVNPNNEEVLLIKANCLEKLGKDTDALTLLNKDLANSNNTGISTLQDLLSKKTKNTIAASYLNIATYDPGISPLHYGYLEYTRKFSTSSVIGRANIGHVNNNTQMLFEADYYRTFSRRNYLYLNAGVSTGRTIFPVTRAGIEYYFTPANKLEYSLGSRYMHFTNDDITLLTGSLGYNFNICALSYRPFYDTANELFSHVLSLQKMNEKRESLIRFELQYGNIPYLYLYNGLTGQLKAYRAGIQYQQRFGKSFFIRPVFLYEYEEYLPAEYRNRFNVQLIATKKL